MTRATAPICLVLTLILSACGGSGGDPVLADPPAPAPTVVGGAYHVVENGAVTGTQLSVWGTAVLDGFGEGERSVRTHENGVYSAYVDEAPFAYAEPGDGLLRIDRSAHPYGVACEGAETATGDIAALSTMGDGDMPSVQVLLRRASGLIGTELDDKYHTVLSIRSSAEPAIGGFGTTTFVGGITGNIQWAPFNRLGSVSGVIPPEWPLGFAVAPDGFVRIAHATLGAFDGGVTSDGELCVVGGAHRADGSLTVNVLLMFLRHPLAATSDATFMGRYAVVGMDVSPTTGRYRGYSGTLTADGVGGASFSPRVNDEGTPGLAAPVVSTYSVGASGQLTFNWGGKSYRGGLSGSGDYAILGGAANDGAPPGYFVLIRR